MTREARVQELCELIAKETDPSTMIELVSELNNLLEPPEKGGFGFWLSET